VRKHAYQIVVSGRLWDASREAFADFTIESNGSNTSLRGALDQSALYDVLNRIQSLGLELIALSRVDGNHREPRE
jgi:hypothetical protein